VCVGEGRFEGVDGAARERDEREVDTADKLVFCALQNGSFEVFDLGSKWSLFHSEPGSGGGGSLSAIIYSSANNLLATGSSKGVLSIYATRSLSSLSTPLIALTWTSASIEDLAFAGPRPRRLVVITEDGLPFVARIQHIDAREDGGGSAEVDVDVEAELIGGDCDAVRVVSTREEGEIWTAGTMVSCGC